jgi:hypothetical protein
MGPVSTAVSSAAAPSPTKYSCDGLGRRDSRPPTASVSGRTPKYAVRSAKLMGPPARNARSGRRQYSGKRKDSAARASNPDPPPREVMYDWPSASRNGTIMIAARARPTAPAPSASPRRRTVAARPCVRWRGGRRPTPQAEASRSARSPAVPPATPGPGRQQGRRRPTVPSRHSRSAKRKSQGNSRYALTWG